jgi:hypothetical protein
MLHAVHPPKVGEALLTMHGISPSSLGLPPMLSSTRELEAAHASIGAGLSGRMPSLQSIKVGSISHTDPTLLLDRVRSASQSGMPAVGSTAFSDPAALLARARGEAGMGGLAHRSTLAGVSSLPFQPGSLLRFDQVSSGADTSSAAPKAASEVNGCVAARAGGGSEARPLLGRSALPLIEQHTQMRLQQQQRQPQGLHLPISGLGLTSGAVRSASGMTPGAVRSASIVGRDEGGAVLRTDKVNAVAAADAAAVEDHYASSARMAAGVDDGGLPSHSSQTHSSQSVEASRQELAAPSEGAEAESNLAAIEQHQWAHFWEWTTEELNAGLGAGAGVGEGRRRDGDEAMADTGILAHIGDNVTSPRSGPGGRARGSVSGAPRGRGGRKAGDAGGRGRARGAAGRTARAPASSAAASAAVKATATASAGTQAARDGGAAALRCDDAQASAVRAACHAQASAMRPVAVSLSPTSSRTPHVTAMQNSLNGHPSAPPAAPPLAPISPSAPGEAAEANDSGQGPGNGSMLHGMGVGATGVGAGSWLQQPPGLPDAGATKGSVPMWTGHMLLGSGMPHEMPHWMLRGMLPGPASEYLMHAQGCPLKLRPHGLPPRCAYHSRLSLPAHAFCTV